MPKNMIVNGIPTDGPNSCWNLVPKKAPKKAPKDWRIHNHPKMEGELGVPEGHVIVDKDLYLELIRRFGTRLEP